MAEGRVECLARNGNYAAITATPAERNDSVCCHLLFTIFLNAKLRPSAEARPHTLREPVHSATSLQHFSGIFPKARGKVMKIYARKVLESLIFSHSNEKQ